MELAVAPRFQIVVSSPSRSTLPGTLPGESVPLGLLGRLKLALGGILLASLAVGVLILALILGSIIAAALWILLVLVTVVLVFKAAVRRARK